MSTFQNFQRVRCRNRTGQANAARRNTTSKQYQTLTEVMENHKDIALAWKKSVKDRLRCNEFWSKLAKDLNMLGPARTPKEWLRFWKDWKSRVRTKIWNDSQQQSDGLMKRNTLKTLELRVAEILREESESTPDEVSKNEDLSNSVETENYFDDSTDPLSPFEVFLKSESEDFRGFPAVEESTSAKSPDVDGLRSPSPLVEDFQSPLYIIYEKRKKETHSEDDHNYTKRPVEDLVSPPPPSPPPPSPPPSSHQPSATDRQKRPLNIRRRLQSAQRSALAQRRHHMNTLSAMPARFLRVEKERLQLDRRMADSMDRLTEVMATQVRQQTEMQKTLIDVVSMVGESLKVLADTIKPFN